jgi:histidinol dehydrogenase
MFLLIKPKDHVLQRITYNESQTQLQSFLKRRNALDESVEQSVKDIIKEVQTNGDEAVKTFARQFDKVELQHFKVSGTDLEHASSKIDPKLMKILEKSAENIRRFHEQELEKSFFYEQDHGVIIGQKITPMDRALLYIPGGQAAYPSSVLMNVIPAQVAGVEEIFLTSPCNAQGEVNPVVLCAAHLLGVEHVYKLGGAHAVGAFAYGTESIPKVDIISGPGNKYVAMAKKLVFGQVAIDSIAGPSEIAIIADEDANPEFIALDLFSQAEHDQDASAILITPSQTLADKVDLAIADLLPKMSRKSWIEVSLKNNSAIILTRDINQACHVSNLVAPEYLEVQTAEPWSHVSKLKHAGAIFLGAYSSEPVGDYYAGPNHTLPTSGTARFFSPLSTRDFMKRSSLISYTREMLMKTGEDIATFADSEGLEAHAEAIRIRLKSS